MGKSLGDYNIEKSSSSDLKNIKWSQKNPTDTEKPKKKKTGKTSKISATNIIYTDETKKVTPIVDKIFKVEVDSDTEKPKKKNADKRFQNSSASNCKIKQGFIRPAR